MRKRFHGLKKGRVRQDWSKWTLYNLSRMPVAGRHSAKVRTYFQQKWAAKSWTRAFHGEQIREKIWQRMFSKKIPSVVSMDPAYMAKYDGSEQAAGRGRGQDMDLSTLDGQNIARKMGMMEAVAAVSDVRGVATPYMQMVYYPIERRLDVAVWRALFASSTRQARQFVTHGWVNVNGKPMRHPGYLLNPGDMFQIEPERVMFATGAKKENNHQTRQNKKKWERYMDAIIRGEDPKMKKKTQAALAAEADDDFIPQEGQTEGEPKPSEPSAEATTENAEPTPLDTKYTLQALLKSARAINRSSKTHDLSASRKQELRAFQHLLKRTLSKSSSTDETTTLSLSAQFDALKLKLSPPSRSSSDADADAAEQEATLAAEDERALAQAIERLKENPRDESKPYATPWRPRRYMSAFAFIPRYLEVNQNICAAVYLRHPVARPGMAEVPTPFAPETSQLAFNWYLRRR